MSKTSVALPLTGSRTIIYDLQTYHASHYGRKISRDIVKISAALPLMGIRTLITIFKPTTIARNGYRGMFEGRKFSSVNSIYDLQSYHASHYGRKISRDNVKNFSRITTYGESNSNLRPPNYQDIHYGRQISRGIIKIQPHYHLRGVELLSTTSKPTTLAIMVEKWVELLSKNSAAQPLTGSRTIIYDLQTYHASHYGRKISRDIVKISAALPLMGIRTLITIFKPTTIARKGYRGRFEGRKFSSVYSIYDLQSYHASHYGRKISRDNVKNFSRITTYGESNSNLRPPNYQDIHYG